MTAPQYVRLWFPAVELWVTGYRFDPLIGFSIETTNHKSKAKIFVTPNLAEVAELGRRFSKISAIAVDQSTFDEWVESEAGTEATP